MASMTAATLTSAISPAALVATRAASSSPVLGLPMMTTARGGRARCSVKKADMPTNTMSMPSAVAAAATAMMSGAGPALALVDERMSTEGTGLSLGVSNNLLGWILLGVFGLIWALFFIYTSTLEEDEESGLSL
ncbi:hypothetical protein QJS04_geneDACA007435 [Acorus gramineus]|uniref:PSII 6.1 kDa protein n=1 Tax=Acorus gramineus TaxID=55184 RepID=A0AAV9B7J2_ACOGR|nr:hypothetical protein QJS04_geneDACA007435 [Acorus gramineus]